MTSTGGDIIIRAGSGTASSSMSNHGFKVGEKVLVKKRVCGWEASTTQLENKTGVYEIAMINDNQALICFGKGNVFHDEHSFDDYDHFPNKFRGKGYRFWWIPITCLEKIDMIDNLKSAAKSGAKAYSHGVTVGAAHEGVDFAYKMLCGYLNSQFGISHEKLNDPLNKEVLQTAAVFMLQVASGALEDKVPGMNIVQNGCSLALEAKGRDHFKDLFVHIAPMLMHISSLMNPEKYMERLTKQVEAGLSEAGFNEMAKRFGVDIDSHTQNVHSEAEAEAEAHEEMLVQRA